MSTHSKVKFTILTYSFPLSCKGSITLTHFDNIHFRDDMSMWAPQMGVSIFSKSGILKVGRGEIKDLYVYKWVPGQTNYFIHFDCPNLGQKVDHDKITNGLPTFILSSQEKTKESFIKQTFHFLSKYIFIFGQKVPQICIFKF